MSKGFGKPTKVDEYVGIINSTEVDKVLKRYKKIKKYMNSSFFELNRINKSEKIVKELLEELEVAKQIDSNDELMSELSGENYLTDQ
jgi:uncharacterized protein YwgA